MNKASTISPTRAWIECDDCDGTGSRLDVLRWAGEGNGGELSSRRCETCEGDGGCFADDDDFVPVELDPATKGLWQ